MYYNKLKKLWKELNVLQPIPQCTCGVISKCNCNASGIVLDLKSQNKLIQFLMGLNESYDAIKSQILILDQLPTVNKAYLMVLRVEKHRAIQVNLLENAEGSVILMKSIQHNYTSHTKGQ